MTDLISRQAAIDALMSILDRKNHAEFLYTDEICKALGDLPSAQPEIIHCKDCANWKVQVKDVKGDGLGCCNFHNANFVTGEGYCYWAERRTDG